MRKGGQIAAKARQKPPAPAGRDHLEGEIKALRARVASLEQEVADLKAQTFMEGVIVLRTIPREEAKEEIRAMFATGRTLYYSDIARELRLELPQVVDLCQELEQEGEIEADAHPV